MNLSGHFSGLKHATNFTHDAIFEQNFDLKLLHQIFANSDLKHALDLTLINFLAELHGLDLLELLQNLVFLFEELAFFLINLDLNVVDLLTDEGGEIGGSRVGVLLLNVADRAVSLDFELLKLSVKPIDLLLQLFLRFGFPALGHDRLDGNGAFQQELRGVKFHRGEKGAL